MPSVLVTGASRGIGNAIANHLASIGWDVIAGVRSDEDFERLQPANPRFLPVRLDVTDAEHLAALPDALPDRLDAVVNNAGVAVAGPLEAVSLDDMRRQLEINVVGQLAVTQVVLPRLRESHGRIVFISSVNGRLVLPMMGAYCASKFALEAAADTLRLELKPWGIKVVIVEPAQTSTDMWHTSDAMVADLEANMAPEMRKLYSHHLAGMKKALPAMRKMAKPVKGVSDVVEESLTARRPRARYVVGRGTKVQVAAATRLPTPVQDRLLKAAGGVPKKL